MLVRSEDKKTAGSSTTSSIFSTDEQEERLTAVAAAAHNPVDGPDLGLVVGAGKLLREDARSNLLKKIDSRARQMQKDTDQPQTADRLQLLRDELARRDLDGFIVPMDDEYKNEYVPLYAYRLRWLTGFLGSAGTLVVLPDCAAVFVDARYTLQVQQQVDLELLETLDKDEISTWLETKLCEGQKFGYDPMLHSEKALKPLLEAAEKVGVALTSVASNPVDAVWVDQPPRPLSAVVPHDIRFSGESSADKRKRIAELVSKAGADALIVSSVASVCWLLNIRGGDVSRTPLALAFAIISASGDIDLITDERKVSEELCEHLGIGVRIHAERDIADVIGGIARGARILLDPERVPIRFVQWIEQADGTVVRDHDPCHSIQPVKNPVEIAGARACQIRDGVAMTRFLAWFERESVAGRLDERTAARKLQELRSENEYFRDLSFDTIAASGPNAFMAHYVPSSSRSRRIRAGEMFLVDSGGQYLDGTTDTTRTIAVGVPSSKHREVFTHVLRAHIALAVLRFPAGTVGMQLDAIAKAPMWNSGMNLRGSIGHGIGSYLGVHEVPPIIGPRYHHLELRPGMLVTNEPGHYIEGEYGVRTENVQLVADAGITDADVPFYEFETLTMVPIDLKLVEPSLMSGSELAWLNTYHTKVCAALAPYLSGETLRWLETATREVSHDS